MRILATALHCVYDEPSFEAPLLNSLTLKRGTGNPTFTRSDTADYSATVTDFEGLIRPVKNGEARFEGARREENLIPTSSASLASGANKTITVTAGDYVFSMGAGASSGVATFSGTGGATGTLTQNATSRTAANKFTLTAGTFIVTASVATLVDLQFSNVTGKANQNPAEYVSVGVLSAPYHGAGVPNVQYFATTNGNTVSNNVVTEAVGTPIADATLHGYLAEGSRVNALLYSNLFSSPWTTPNSTLSAVPVTAPNGSLNSIKLSETVANGNHYLAYSSITRLVTITLSVYAKAAERDVLLLELGNFAVYRYSLSLGTVLNLGWDFGPAGVATIQAVGNGWYRCSLTGTSTSIQSAYIGICYTGGSPSYVGDITKGIYIWGAQLEDGAFASSYIPTVASAVTRGVDYLTYPITYNFDATKGTVYSEVSTLFSGSSGVNSPVVFSGASSWLLSATSATNMRPYDGVNNPSRTCLTTYQTVRKHAISWGGVSFSLVSDGAAPTSATFRGYFPDTVNLFIGSYSSGALFGTIRKIKIWKIAKSDTYLKAITA